MPDILSVFARRWKTIAALTLMTTALSFLICLLLPKEYRGVATALPANPALGDRASIFNQNIEGLYAALGSPDELDKIEGTSRLDTVYLALVKDFNLVAHYKQNDEPVSAIYKAANRLKKHTSIKRTGYGELRVEVWDRQSRMAADLANATMHRLNAIHSDIQTENYRLIAQRLREEYARKQSLLANRQAGMLYNPSNNPGSNSTSLRDTVIQQEQLVHSTESTIAQKEQLAQYAKIIAEYELAIQTAPNVLLMVDKARPPLYADNPKTAQIVGLAFVAAFLFSFLLSLFVETRNQQK